MGKKTPRPIRPADEAFWSQVDKSGDCWIWTGKDINRDGYGKWNGIGAHRIALNSSIPLPAPDLRICALHHCDNPPCCNPAHLYWGTRAQNLRDRTERHPRFRLARSHEAEALMESVIRLTAERAAAAAEYQRVNAEWQAAVAAAANAQHCPAVAKLAGVSAQRVSQIKQEASELAA